MVHFFYLIFHYKERQFLCSGISPKDSEQKNFRRDAVERVLWDTKTGKIVIDKYEQMFYPNNNRTFVPDRKGDISWKKTRS